MTALATSSGVDGLPPGFLDVPRHIYAGDPMWIPESPAAVERAFSANNAWFRDGRALCLAAADDARLAVFHRPSMVIDGRPAAFFGYWETRAEPEVDAALFDRAVAWAREQGAEDLYGPIDFSTYGDYRLRTSAEPGAITFPAEPYNPADYPQRLERLGFDTAYTYLSQMAPTAHMAPQSNAKRHVQGRLADAGYRQETLTPAVWLAHLDALHALVDRTFAANFAYTPLPLAAFRVACGPSFIRKICPVTSSITFAPDGTIAAFGLMYPHYGPLVVQGAGDARVEVGALDYEAHAGRLDAHPPTAVLIKTVGVHPDHRGAGLSNATVVRALDRGLGRYEMVYGAMVRSDNLTRRFSGGTHTGERWYALYHQRVA